MAATDPIDPTGVEMQQLRAEFDSKLAETAHRNAEARKFDAEAFKLGQEGRFYPFVVFGAGSVFTVLLGAIIAALLHWLGVPAR